jgi:hypothetical protein
MTKTDIKHKAFSVCRQLILTADAGFKAAGSIYISVVHYAPLREDLLYLAINPKFKS